MSCSVSSKYYKANLNILSWFSVNDTGILSNFKIKHSNYANWNYEIHILSSSSYHALQLLKQSNLIPPPISAFDTLLTLAEFTKKAIYPATA